MFEAASTCEIVLRYPAVGLVLKCCFTVRKASSGAEATLVYQ